PTPVRGRGGAPLGHTRRHGGPVPGAAPGTGAGADEPGDRGAPADLRGSREPRDRPAPLPERGDGQVACAPFAGKTAGPLEGACGRGRLPARPDQLAVTAYENLGQPWRVADPGFRFSL